MKIATRKEEEVTILSLDGRLTIGEGDVELRTAVGDLLERGVTQILLDMKKVRTMDSSGLGELIRCKTSAIHRGAVIKLVHVEEKVEQVMTMTRLIGVFDTFDNPIDAVASFRTS